MSREWRQAARLVLVALAALVIALTGLNASAMAAERPAATSAGIFENCNNYVCIDAEATSATTGRVRAYFQSAGCLAESHFHFWGPGHNFNDPQGRHCSYQWTRWYGPYPRGKYCVEGWWWVRGWESMGLPCETI
jgi:hypothetical protein